MNPVLKVSKNRIAEAPQITVRTEWGNDFLVKMADTATTHSLKPRLSECYGFRKTVSDLPIQLSVHQSFSSLQPMSYQLVY